MGQNQTKFSCGNCRKKLESHVVSTVCGHLYHEDCIAKKNECLICKKPVNQSQLRQIFINSTDQKENLTDKEEENEVGPGDLNELGSQKKKLEDDLKQTIQRMETQLSLVVGREGDVNINFDRVERIERMREELQEIKQIAKDFDVVGAMSME